jgi:hypothetical protein
MKKYKMAFKIVCDCALAWAMLLFHPDTNEFESLLEE